MSTPASFLATHRHAGQGFRAKLPQHHARLFLGDRHSSFASSECQGALGLAALYKWPLLVDTTILLLVIVTLLGVEPCETLKSKNRARVITSLDRAIPLVRNSAPMYRFSSLVSLACFPIHAEGGTLPPNEHQKNDKWSFRNYLLLPPPQLPTDPFQVPFHGLRIVQV